jgi:uncharacterized protein with HEPN domain
MIRSRDPLPYLQDIIDCITRIKRYTQGVDVTAFMNNVDLELEIQIRWLKDEYIR